MKHVPQRWFLFMAAFFLLLQTFFTLFFCYPTIDKQFYANLFVFATSRLLLMLAAQMLFIAVIYWSFHTMKRHLHPLLGKIHFFTTFVSILLFGWGLIASGFFSNVRTDSDIGGSFFDYSLRSKSNVAAGYLLLFAQVIFVINCLSALFFNRQK
jgi:heme/copper-type cytochrome/quinol oxidase subunit 1